MFGVEVLSFIIYGLLLGFWYFGFCVLCLGFKVRVCVGDKVRVMFSV